MTMKLTPLAVKAAKPPKAGRTIRRDGIVPGMRLITHSGGKKSYRIVARIHGKQVNLPIGDAKVLTLNEARDKGKDILAAIAKGEDPRVTKQQAIRTASETVAVVAKKFIERYARANNKTRTWQETERLIARNILPRWGTRPITSIEPRDVTELLDAVADRAPIAANRVLAAGRKMFNWAYDHHLIETSPFGRIKAPTKETSRDRKHADFELALIWQAAGQLCYPFGPFTQLAILLGQRREEIAGMRWSELDSELTLWTLPRKRTKNGVQHQVPITPQARTILAGLRLQLPPF